MRQLKASIGSPQNPSLDDVCYLISSLSTFDNLGQAIIEEKLHMVFCSKLSITRAEFSSAGAMGFKPNMILIADADSYQEEQNLEYNNKRYSIYKTFMRKDNFIELYCEEKQGDKN